MDDLKQELESRRQLACFTCIIPSAPDSESLLAEAQDRICELLDAERLSIDASDPKTQRLRSVHHGGDGLKAIELTLGRGSLAGCVAMTGESGDVPDASDAQALGAVHLEAPAVALGRPEVAA